MDFNTNNTENTCNLNNKRTQTISCLNLIQANLHKSPTAMSELTNVMIKENIHIAQVTEPPIIRSTNKPYGYLSTFKAFHTNDFTKMIRSLILIHPCLHEKTIINLIEQQTSHDYTTISINLKITNAEMSYIFKDVSQNKAPGKDMINSAIAENFRKNNPEILLELYQKCIDLAIFPNSWKLSVVVPIHKEKKGTASNPKNYRPIGLLSILGKGLEKIINTRLTYHLINKNILHKNQHGFTPTKSTLTALNSLYREIKEQKSKNKFCAILALDIAGAFDNLPWDKTIEQLVKMKYPTQYTKIMTDYFINRRYEL